MTRICLYGDIAAQSIVWNEKGIPKKPSADEVMNTAISGPHATYVNKYAAFGGHLLKMAYLRGFQR